MDFHHFSDFFCILGSTEDFSVRLMAFSEFFLKFAVISPKISVFLTAYRHSRATVGLRDQLHTDPCFSGIYLIA